MAKCPVCKSDFSAADKECQNCGFTELQREFINQDELLHWMEQTVIPCRAIYKKMLTKCETSINDVSFQNRSQRVTTVTENKELILDNFEATDVGYFGYELENGMEITDNGNGGRVDWLNPYVKRGIRITSYNGFDTDRIVVPDKIDGRPVVSIGVKAFKNVNAKEIVIPSSIIAILAYAFDDCEKLEYVNLPEKMVYMGEYCFCNSGIRSIKFPNSISYVSTSCFLDCTNLSKVTLSNTTKTIYDSAFLNCSSLKTIELPSSLKEIGKHSFCGTSLDYLVIPSGVSTVSKECFYWSYARRKSNIACVFEGKDTIIPASNYDRILGIHTIYCLPGSNIQRIARECSVPVRPLSEFNREEFQ